jgi:hypothetical protein
MRKRDLTGIGLKNNVHPIDGLDESEMESEGSVKESSDDEMPDIEDEDIF